MGERPDCGLWVRETCLGLSASMSDLTACDLARLLNISEPSSSKGSETRMLLPTAQDGYAESVTKLQSDMVPCTLDYSGVSKLFP